jgi:hypothetical protein
LALFDTINDETNSSQISGGIDGVGLVVKMGRSFPSYFGTGPKLMGRSSPCLFGTGQQVFGQKIALAELRSLNQGVWKLELYHYIA